MTSVELFPQWRARIDTALDNALPDASTSPQRLSLAMRHAVMLGGKRMRPLLAYAAAQAIDPDVELHIVDSAAIAIEVIHAYSLIHDDLPCMDDDVLRRGQPTVHVKFDEATAVLAGDALQTLAFETIAEAPWNPALKVRILQSVSRATGFAGMCGGQALDIDATNRQITLQELQRVHSLKTGALIASAVECGALVAADGAYVPSSLLDFARTLGVAFQVRDDVLDIEGDAQTLGKTVGKDEAQNKSTYPALLGLDESKRLLEELHLDMKKALEPFGTNASALLALAELTVQRQH